MKDSDLVDVALSAEEQKAFYVELDTINLTPPVAYDARDIFEGGSVQGVPGTEPGQLLLMLRLLRCCGPQRAHMLIQPHLALQRACLAAADDRLRQPVRQRQFYLRALDKGADARRGYVVPYQTDFSCKIT